MVCSGRTTSARPGSIAVCLNVTWICDDSVRISGAKMLNESSGWSVGTSSRLCSMVSRLMLLCTISCSSVAVSPLKMVLMRPLMTSPPPIISA